MNVRKSLEKIRREGGGRLDRAHFGSHSESDAARMAADDDTPEPDDKTLRTIKVVYPVRK